MSVKIAGMKKLQQELESRFGTQEMNRINDKALKAGAEVMKESLIRELRAFEDTGATIDELTFTEPRDVNGVRTITFHWQGPKKRYAIIHLNEFGTIRNPNPNGKGAIARAVANAKKKYAQVVKEEIRKGM